MNYNQLNKALKDFGRYVVDQSKANLKKDKKGDGDLYNSISYKFRQETNAFLLEFLMEDYGTFQDQGVKGANPDKVSPNSKKGQFAKGGYKSMGYVIAKNIYNRGLKPSYFFTEPFEKAFANLPDEVLNQFSIDVENQLTLGIKQ